MTTLAAWVSGILIPVLDSKGRIQAFQIRADEPGPERPRYTWLSSKGREGGASSGVPVGVWRPELAQVGPVWITEGSLKAAIASYHLNACVIGVAGVGNWKEVPSVLTTLNSSTGVVVAYDSDAATKPQVGHQREQLARSLSQLGHEVYLSFWSPALKGIDDALLAGAAIERQKWRPRLRSPIRPSRTQRLGAPRRPTTSNGQKEKT